MRTPRPPTALLSPIIMAVVLASLTPRTGLAQQDPHEQEALALFDQATADLKSGNLDDAASKYRAAYALWPRAQILLNIAGVLLELKRPAESANTYQLYLEHKDAAADKKQQVRDVIADLDKELARLRVTVTGRGEVTVDGSSIGEGPFARLFRVAPGEHIVALSAGETSDDKTIVVVAGEEKTVELVGETGPIEPVAAPIAVSSPTTTPIIGKPYVWTGAATAGLVVAGIAFGVRANSSYGKWEDEAAKDEPLEPRLRKFEDETTSRALRANISFAVAGAAGLATAILLVLDLRSRDSGEPAGVGFGPTRDGATIGYTGRF